MCLRVDVYKRQTLSHAEEIKAGLYRVGQTLYSDEGGLLYGLKECLNTMLGLQRVYPVAGELAEQMCIRDSCCPSAGKDALLLCR